MATIEEMNSKMTIFYSKQTGEIKASCGGIQDMNFFGSNKIDFEIIYDFIVIDKDDYVLNNIDQFKIVDAKVKLKEAPEDLAKYL